MTCRFFTTFFSIALIAQVSLDRASAVDLNVGNPKDRYVANYKENKNHICSICSCKTNSVTCFSESKHIDSMPNAMIDLTLNKSHFEGIHKQIKNLIIDFDPYSVNLRIQHNAFYKLVNLRILFVTNIIDLNKMPNLENSFDIREITIQDSGLKQVSTEFCARKKQLQKIDFSFNELSDLKFVFDQCDSLKMLDLSYNKIKSLKEVFSDETSNLVILNLNNNLIEEIGESDLVNLAELTEISLAKNKIEIIHKNAFNNLKKLIKLNMAKNNLHELPAKSIAYASLKQLNVHENRRLLNFPDSNQFKSLQKLEVHYSYHCCPFLKRKPSHLQSDEIEIHLDSR
jgi:Leucine-rich repeat (LRR) protein